MFQQHEASVSFALGGVASPMVSWCSFTVVLPKVRRRVAFRWSLARRGRSSVSSLPNAADRFRPSSAPGVRGAATMRDCPPPPLPSAHTRSAAWLPWASTRPVSSPPSNLLHIKRKPLRRWSLISPLPPFKKNVLTHRQDNGFARFPMMRPTWSQPPLDKRMFSRQWEGIFVGTGRLLTTEQGLLGV